MVIVALIYGLMGLIISTILTPLVKSIVTEKEILDQPSDVKIHTEPIPRAGGIAIVVAFFVAIILFLGTAIELRTFLVLLAIAVIVAVGLIDDIKGLKPVQKLLGQSIAALIFAFSQPYIGTLSPIIGGILAFIFIMLICNAVNLIDGLDGLAAGLSAIAALGFAAVGILMDNPLLVGLSAIVAGSALGFLPYNWSPAKIFMGDTGSLFLGFSLGAIAVVSIQKAEIFSLNLVPLFILSVPIFDIIITVLRRVINRKPLFSADLYHSYNIIQKKGLTTRAVVLLYYLAAIVFGCMGVLIAYFPQGYISYLLLILMLAFYVFVVFMYKLLGVEEKSN